ncbi:MAG: rod shape-determining protein MreD [Bacteroidota bacterium]
MNNAILPNLWRLVFFVLMQWLVLQQVQLGGSSFNYISLFIYPLFLFLLPLETPKVTLVLIGFVLGIIIDACYNSPGVHAATCLITVMLRPVVLAIFKPRDGYKVGKGLTIKSYGVEWFGKYVSLLLFLHLSVYFILEIFTPTFALEIFLRTVASFIFSLIIIAMYMFIAGPKI